MLDPWTFGVESSGLLRLEIEGRWRFSPTVLRILDSYPWITVPFSKTSLQLFAMFSRHHLLQSRNNLFEFSKRGFLF